MERRALPMIKWIDADTPFLKESNRDSLVTLRPHVHHVDPLTIYPKYIGPMLYQQGDQRYVAEERSEVQGREVVFGSRIDVDPLGKSIFQLQPSVRQRIWFSGCPSVIWGRNLKQIRDQCKASLVLILGGSVDERRTPGLWVETLRYVEVGGLEKVPLQLADICLPN